MESALNIEVSCFANYSTPGNPKTVNMLAWLTSDKHAAEVGRIRTIGDKDERDVLKAELPCITPSGTFTYRAADRLVKHSGLLQFDIDLQDNTGIGNYDQLRELVCQSRHVAYCGLSVSGTGIWGLIPVEIATAEMHKPYFRYIKAWFANSGIAIDEKPQNVASLRGYSIDGNAYFNNAATPLSKHMAETPAKAAVRHVRPAANIGGFEGEAFDWCVRVKDESLFAPGNRNGWLTRLVNLLNERGVSRKFAESECVGRYAQDGFDGKEILATIRSIYRSKQATHASNPYTGAKTMLPDAKPYIWALASGSIKTPVVEHPGTDGKIVSFQTAKPAFALPYPIYWDGPAEPPARGYWLRRETAECAASADGRPSPETFVRLAFAPGTWADVEVERIATGHGFTFALVAGCFTYLQRADIDGRICYWYGLPEYESIAMPLSIQLAA